MSQKSLGQLFRRWVARGNRAAAPRPTARLRLEEVEHRLVPATTPGVTVAAATTVPNTTGTYAPQVVADPTNPNTLAMVTTAATGIIGQISFDGGATWAKFRDTTAGAGGDPSGGKLIDPTFDPRINSLARTYTNASEATIAFSRNGSIYLSYLQHNAAKTSGALVVDRFDLDRATQTLTQYDLDPRIDFDNDPSTTATERWKLANGGANKTAVLYQWVDDGTNVERPANPYLAVDTNLPTFTDPTTGQTVTDPFVANGGGDTVFVAWNMIASAPVVSSSGDANSFFYQSGTPVGFTPNAVMLAVGRADPLDLRNRANPDAAPSAANPRTPYFEFSTPVPVNDGVGASNAALGLQSGGFFMQAANDTTGGAAPVVNFTPPSLRPNGTVAPGQMTVTWSTVNSQIAQSTTNLGAGPGDASYTFRSNDLNSNTGFFADGVQPPQGAPNNTPDGASTTTFDLPVDLTPFTQAQGGAFTTLDDLNVTLALTAPRLQDLNIQLIAPDGTVITLVENRINGLGNTRGPFAGITPGLSGTDLGVTGGTPGYFLQNNAVPGNAVGTVFDQEAARNVEDPNNPAHFVASYRPETGSLAAFYGRTAGQLNSLPGANWRLSITDVRNDRVTTNNVLDTPVQFLRFWSMTFTSHLDNSNTTADSTGTAGRLGADKFITGLGGSALPVGVLPGRVSTAGFGADQTYPNQPAASPAFGVGPGVSVAYDTSLGSFSQYGGRMYVVYTGGGGANTNIFLVSSDDNGATWTKPLQVNDDSVSDNFSEGTRTQFQPSVTVDPTTGTVVVMWYDARQDASDSRAATYVATSIDGGVTFSPSRPVNATKTAVDAITGATVKLESVPTNFQGLQTNNAGTFQYGGAGIRQSVVAYGGVIRPFYTGNLNAANSSAVLTATVLTAAGPRVVGSDMGAVTEQSVDTDPLGNQLQTGAIQVRDEDNFPAVISDAFGQVRTQYNDQFAPDGTRLIDGFRVVFDRPVYFGTGATQATAVADPTGEGFDASDVTVRFRGTTGLLDTGTQGALVPLKGVVPIGGYSVTYTDPFGVSRSAYFATAYFVQFATPQSATGTYSYAVSPTVSDRTRSVAGASFRAADTPLAIPDFPGAGAASTVIVPPVVTTATNAAALAQNLLVGLSVTHRDLSDLTATLTHTLPDGTTRSAVLFNAGDLFGTSIQNMRFSDAGGSVFAATSPTYTGVFQPAQSFAAAFGGTPLAGVWTLTVTDEVAGLTGTLDAWRVESLTAPVTAQVNGTPTGGGTPVAVTRTGNGLDQDADATQREAANDTYSAPGSLSGAPFTGPYDTNTRPLIAPGPHVVHVYPGGQQATAVTAVINNFSASALDVTLDREVDASTLPGNVTVVGPNGPITPTAVNPTGVINGATKTFTLTFASTLPSGSYKVTLNNKVYVTDDTVLNGTTDEVFVRFDRDINPASFTAANVLRVTGPSGPLSLAGVTVTPVAEDRTPLAPGAATARLFRVTFDQPAAVLTADSTTIGFTLDAPPTAPLMTSDVVAVIGPNGPVSLAGATLTGSGTSYTLTFPTAQPKGSYTILLNPTPSRVTATQPAASASLPFTLSAVPPSGQLTLADIASVTGPNGTVSLAGATLSGSGTSYTLTFASAQPAGVYTINLSPTAVRRVEVHGSGAVLSGGYTIEFGSNPAQANDYLAAIRSADRPQLVTARTAASNTLDIPLSAVNGLLSKNDILRVVGPNGLVDISGATLTGPVTSNGVQTYTLTFPVPLPAGQYVVDLDPSAARNIRVAGSGLPVDQNFNAGLDLVTGRSAAGTATVEQVYASTALPVAITPGTDTGTQDANGNEIITPSVSTMSITVTDDFVITQDALNKVEVLLDIKHPNDRDLTIELVPPAASGLDPVLLYNGADATPFQTGKTANFRNTRLVDRVGDPNFPSILQAQPDYFAGATSGFTPQSPLSVLADPNKPVSARGTWTLRVTNHGTNQIPAGTSYPAGTPIQITDWQLSLPRAIPGTGLGERGADRFQAGFRVFNLDPLNATSHTDWTPVGPASANETANSGRVTSVAVDPSDPSGNTVYVAGASGGVWKTTDFLTSDIDGPHFVPLTDFGPSLAVNVQSVALFPRNNDPGQTIVFALTGEGNNLPFRQGQYTAAGVGVLRSTDGGKTWAVLDSTNNVSSDPSVPPGTVGKVSDPGRDRLFVGASGFKIVVDPNPAPDGGVIAYMAVSGGKAGAAGLWRTLDGGLHWALVRAGSATDVVLAAGSANTADPLTRQTVINGNLQRLYAAFQGDGVYYTDSAPSASGLILMDGQGGLPSTADVAFLGTPPVGVQNTPNPNGGNGRIALAGPALTSDPVRNSFYKDWLYAAVVSPSGTLAGLYQTKDAGKNWTLVQIPTIPPLDFWGTNNETRPDLDPLGLGQGNYNLTLSVDPSNPAVVYLAGLGASGAGSIKLDLTKLKDAQNFTFYNNSDPAGGFQTATTGGAVVRSLALGTSGAVVRGGSNSTYSTDFINLSRDPNNPFITNSTVRVSNIGSVVNDGSDVFWQPFTDVLGVGDLRAGKSGLGAVSNERESAVQVHSIFPFLDPISGKTRFIYGTDMGVFTGVDASDTVGTGTLHTAVGFDRQVAGSRNGDLQLTQFYSGAVQPSQLAADVAGALFYGMADANGFLVSDPRILANGNTDWRGPEGDGAWVEVDPTGNGYSFQYRSPVNDGLDNNTTALPKDFFRVFLPNTDPEFSGGIGRTFGLIQSGDDPQFNAGQWPANPEALGFKFAVNPVNPNVLVIASNVGRVFRTTDQGATWLPIGQPGQLDGTGPGAQAFGAADPNNPALTNNFIYVGTASGRVFVTTTGGGTWTNVTVGSLDGSPIQRIVPNPAAGSKEVYLVTERGVYYKADGTDNTTAWVNITGGLFNVKRAAFGDTQDLFPALPQSGRALNALAVDWRFANTPGTSVAGAPVTTPDLYVGGVGGVFKSSDFGNTWRLFPDIATDGALADGGYMPSVEVTDLDLSVGNIDPRTGKYQAGGLNLLLASTYGRGSYAIRLSDALQPQSFIKGPQVTAVINPNTPAPPSSAQSSDRLDIQFSGPVDPATLKPENFQLLPVDVAGNPTGAPVQILSVTPVTGSGIANRYEIAFVTQTRAANGSPTQYRLTVGYNADGSGVPTITDPSGFRMDQDGDTINGEPVVDQFIQSVTLNGASNSLVTTVSPTALVAGVPGTVTIRERDSSGNTVNDNGTLTVTSTGPGPVVLLDQNGNPLVDNNGNPVNTVRLVNGVATFQVQMTVAGAYTIAATTGVNVNPTSFNTTVTAAAAASVTLAPGQQTTTSGGAVTYTLGFQDQFGNTAAYSGTATITYGGAAVDPASPTSVPVNTSASPPQNSFTVTTKQAGTVTVTATMPKPGGGTLTSNQATITVNPGAATAAIVTPAPGPYVVGQPITVTVTIKDANGNVVPVNGALSVNPGSDPGAVVNPTSPQLVNGTATFTVTYQTPGQYPIVVTAPGGVSGSTPALTVGAVPPRPSPTETLTGVYAAATGVDGNPTVTVFNPNGTVRAVLNPFPPGYAGEVDAGSVGFTGGIRVSVADVTGDKVPDYVVATGPTITATVLVIDGATNRTVLTLRPFADFKGGVFVSTGDIDGDGINDIVITPDQGGGPRVTVLQGGTFHQIANFFGIDDPNFRGGARAALGDINGDGYADLVVSAGFGGGPRISIYDGGALAGKSAPLGTRLNVVGDFFAFEQTLRNGTYVAVGDVNGDGLADVIIGAGPGGGPRAIVLDSATLLTQGSAVALQGPIFNAFLGDPDNRGGVRVAAKNIDGDKFTDLVVGSGEGGGDRVDVYSGKDFSLIGGEDLLPGYTGGVFVG